MSVLHHPAKGVRPSNRGRLQGRHGGDPVMRLSFTWTWPTHTEWDWPLSCGQSHSIPRPHPWGGCHLMLPTEMPPMNDFWNSRKSTITGSTTSVDAAIIRLNRTSYELVAWKNVKPIGSV